MTNLDMLALIVRAVYAVGTLYMMAILLRWLGPWLDLDLYSRRLAWIRIITDPLINAIRGVLPTLGPMDFAPLIALLTVWIARTLVVGMLLSLHAPSV